MVNWILNFFGIVAYFCSKYKNRRNKNTKGTASYWLKDNFIEAIGILSVNASLMILLMLPETVVYLDKILSEKFPFIVAVAAKPTASFLLGLGFSSLIYNGIGMLKKIKIRG